MSATVVKLAKTQVVGIKVESTQNTAVALSTSDYVLAETAEPEVVAEFNPRNYPHQSLDQLPHTVGQLFKKVKIRLEDKGSGTAGTPYGPLDAAIQAAGHSSTASGGVSVTYAPISAAPSNMFGPGKSVTIEVYWGYSATALKYRLKGAVAESCKLVMEAGKPMMWEFTFVGLYEAITDAAFPSTSYNTALPPVANGATFTLHSTSLIISKLEIDWGLKVSKRDDPTATYGVRGFLITGREPKGSCDPEAETVATHDFFGRMIAGTSGTMALVVGATAGHITTLSLPAVQYMELKPGARDSGIAMFDLGLRFSQSSGDDWISIVKT